MREGGIEIAPDLVIAEEDLLWTFSTSGGPGGQHANRSATRAELKVDLLAALPSDIATGLVERMGKRAKNGIVSVSVDETRSQARNREIARERLRDLLVSALKEPKPRRPTARTRASREKRLGQKRRRSETKELRKKPPMP